MKISDLKVWVVASSREAVQWVFIRVDTDEGISGWGEAPAAAVNHGLVVGQALRQLAPELVGLDPAQIDPIWHHIFRRYTYVNSRGLGTGVAAAVDMALWDIKGKATGRPVYDLLGGRFHERIPIYVNVWWDASDLSPAAYDRTARENILGQGYTACKLDPFHEMRPRHRSYLNGQISEAGEQAGYAIVAAVREAVGPAVEILIDAHGHYNVASAVRLANTLYERWRIGWFEEPVPPESPEALRQVRERCAAPICVGERLFTRFDFVPILNQRLADYVMPDVGHTGGISELVKIARMAEAYNVLVSPHVVPGGPYRLLAAAHAVSAIPNFYRLEHSFALIPVHAEMLDQPYEISHGELILNGRPGLGYDLNEGWLEEHTLPEWRL